MLFLDPWFWRFAAIAILGYWVLPRPAKLAWLIATSATFHYHFAGPVSGIYGIRLLQGVNGVAVHCHPPFNPAAPF